MTTQGWSGRNRKMHDALAAASIEHYYREGSGDHTWASAAASVKRMLRILRPDRENRPRLPPADRHEQLSPLAIVAVFAARYDRQAVQPDTLLRKQQVLGSTECRLHHSRGKVAALVGVGPIEGPLTLADPSEDSAADTPARPGPEQPRPSRPPQPARGRGCKASTTSWAAGPRVGSPMTSAAQARGRRRPAAARGAR